MKPIRLKFSGLQSYRDEQDIVFENLGLHGIFGVFGPTGSGKSTILDAITLALFGKVERAKNGTRGIMNQFETKLTVSFEFSLGEDSYRAERLYERDKHDMDSVKNKNARLVRISGDNQVLADKSNEVDSRVADLLGMSFEDFSRAVVLPQGKFDQFLKLTGGERAKMLEHIFLLERFGENLSKRVSELEKSLDNQIHTNRELVAQLGDASEGAITQIAASLKQQSNLAEQKAAIRKKAEAAFRDMEQLSGFYKEIAANETRLQNLEQEKQSIQENRAQLEKARKAEPLKSLLNQAEELLVRENSEAGKLKAKEREADEIKTKVNTAIERLGKAVAGEEKLNLLREKELPTAARALELEKQAGKIQGEIEKANAIINEKKAEHQTVTRKGKKLKELSDNLQKKLDELITQKQAAADILSCRSEIENTLNLLATAENAEVQEAEARKVMETRYSKLKNEENKLRLLLAENIKHPMADLKKDYLATLMELVKKVVSSAESDLKYFEDGREKLRTKNIAAELAAKLEEDVQCPVCGSFEHPFPVVQGESDEIEMLQFSEKIVKARETIEKLNEWKRQVGLLYNTCQNIETEISSVHKPNYESKRCTLAEAGERFTAMAVLLAKAASGLHDEFLHQLLRNPTPENIRLVKKRLDETDRNSQIISNELSSTELQVKSLESEIKELRDRFTVLKTEIIHLEETQKAQQKSASELKGKSRDLTGGFTPEEFEESVKRQIADLQNELNNARKLWEDIQKEERVVTQEMTTLKVSFDKTKEHLERVREELVNTMNRDGFDNLAELKKAMLDDHTVYEINKRIEEYSNSLNLASKILTELREKVDGRPFTQELFKQSALSLKTSQHEHEEAVRTEGGLQNQLAEMQNKHTEWMRLTEEGLKLNQNREIALKLLNILKGRKFVQFLAEEHLSDMTAEASMRLGTLTGQRYALELDQDANFVMRDDYSGGLRRPVNTLSGGEVFLTSLAMALALSSKIQLKGRYPLGFFFLDEGFGTLDPEKLEVVMSTLERLHDGHRMVGIITHVQELRNRMPRYLEVIPAKQDGTGSMVKLVRN